MIKLSTGENGSILRYQQTYPHYPQLFGRNWVKLPTKEVDKKSLYINHFIFYPHC